VLREDFGATSDIDVLVQFEDGHTPGWELFDLELELSETLGRRVDLSTPGSSISPFASACSTRRISCMQPDDLAPECGAAVGADREPRPLRRRLATREDGPLVPHGVAGRRAQTLDGVQIA
jgi:predicted nucleotidyltransferase